MRKTQQAQTKFEKAIGNRYFFKKKKIKKEIKRSLFFFRKSMFERDLSENEF